LEKDVISTITLKNCQNVTIKDCELLVSNLDHSSEIMYLNSSIEFKLKIFKSNNIRIDSCNIYKLKLKNSNSVIIEKTNVKKIKKKKDKNIIFKGKS